MHRIRHEARIRHGLFRAAAPRAQQVLSRHAGTTRLGTQGPRGPGTDAGTGAGRGLGGGCDGNHTGGGASRDAGRTRLRDPGIG
jgi:hypothetical protein